MDPEMDDDDDDLRSLSERISPVMSTSYTNHTSPRHNINRNRSLKPQKSISFTNQIYHEENSLPITATTGDIIQMTDGTRKKYNGSSWRRMCSKLNCSYYTQSQGLCKPHLAALKNRQNSKTDRDISPTDQPAFRQDEPKKGDIMTLSNGIRKKYDGRQYRRVCAKGNCAIVVHGSLEYQNGFCPHHYHEYRAKTFVQSSPELKQKPSSLESVTPPVKSVISSPSRKRRRPNSHSTHHHHNQSPVFDLNSKIPIPKPNRRLSIAVIPPSVNIERPNKGDVIQMTNGSRKKFDGVVWRTICSIPECFIAAQRNELCRKHFIKLNGKPNTAPTMVGSARTTSTSSVEERSDTISKMKEESIDYDDNQLHTTNTSTSPNASDDNQHAKQEEFFPDVDEHFDTQIDHTLINTLSASREKFPTTHLKNWLREHRNHPYPSHQEKSQLAQQSSITYNQVTTWFNNARAILRRRQAKIRPSIGTSDEEDKNEQSLRDHKKSSKTRRSFPTYNGVCCRSIGVQCNPSTADQTTLTSTKTSTMTDDEITSDRTLRILIPSSPLKKNSSHEFLSNGIAVNSERKILLTSTCLDDDQMNRVKEFCSKFHIESSNIVDEHTTHLITDEEEGETLVCPLSKKVIQAVARHMYIVTYRWIDACLKAHRILHEKSFEIQGDLTLSSDHHGMQRSRQSILSSNLPQNFLLENFSIILKCNGCQEMMNNEELIELVQLSGAKHTTDSHFSRLQIGITRIVLCEKDYLINRREMYDKCIQAGIHFLTPEWFLETLVQYRIQPFQEYQISP